MKIEFKGSFEHIVHSMSEMLAWHDRRPSNDIADIAVHAREEASDVPSRSTDVGHEGPEGEARTLASTASPPDSSLGWQLIAVHEIGLSSRATNALIGDGMHCVGDVAVQTAAYVAGIKGVPVGAIKTIRDYLAKYGVSWGEAEALAIDTPLSDMPLSGKKPAPAPVSTLLFDEVEEPTDGPTQEEVHTALLDVAKTDGQGPAAAKALMAKYGATMSDGIKAGDRAAVIADAQTLVGA